MFYGYWMWPGVGVETFLLLNHLEVRFSMEVCESYCTCPAVDFNHSSPMLWYAGACLYCLVFIMKVAEFNNVVYMVLITMKVN